MAIKIPKLRVAVAGTSFGSVVQIPVFQSHPRTEVVALSSRRAERAKQTAQDAGIPSYYTSFEQMLDKEKPDIVSIVTPPDLHSPMTMPALHRGIHVLCEKPFALNLDEARRMNQPLRPAFRALLNRMVEAIDQGLPSPSPNFVDAVNSQAVLDAARRSAREGTWIGVES